MNSELCDWFNIHKPDRKAVALEATVGYRPCSYLSGELHCMVCGADPLQYYNSQNAAQYSGYDMVLGTGCSGSDSGSASESLVLLWKHSGSSWGCQWMTCHWLRCLLVPSSETAPLRWGPAGMRGRRCSGWWVGGFLSSSDFVRQVPLKVGGRTWGDVEP